MDAKRTSWIICAGLLAAATGCTELNAKLAARSAARKPEPPAKMQVAEPAPAQAAAPSAEEPDPLDTAVQSYIERIDGVERRASRPAPRTQETELLAAESPVREPANAAQNLPVPAQETVTPTEQAIRPAIARPEPSESAAEQKAAVVPPSPAANTMPETPSVLPPALGSVSVSTTPTVDVPQQKSEPLRPAVNARVAARHVPTTLREFLDQWPNEAADASYRQQLDRRVLSLLAGDYDAARQPLASVSAEQQEIASKFIESLIAIREEHDGDPAGGASRVLENLDALAETLRTRSELRIPTLALCQEVTGFGGYRPIQPAVFHAGIATEFVVYCELRDFVREQREDGLYHSAFELRTRVMNAAGETVLDLRDPDINDACRQQRHDCFIPRLVQLPATLSPGEYVVKVTVVDKLGEKVAENRASFRVAAGP